MELIIHLVLIEERHWDTRQDHSHCASQTLATDGDGVGSITLIASLNRDVIPGKGCFLCFERTIVCRVGSWSETGCEVFWVERGLVLTMCVIISRKPSNHCESQTDLWLKGQWVGVRVLSTCRGTNLEQKKNVLRAVSLLRSLITDIDVLEGEKPLLAHLNSNNQCFLSLNRLGGEHVGGLDTGALWVKKLPISGGTAAVERFNSRWRWLLDQMVDLHRIIHLKKTFQSS